ncbi:putative transcriptional regulator [Hyphomicrobium sp. 1Nfss2.1]|uniref:ATP-binding protein n=1 Tax=Hyphomicrobium sp. 1Nfss2.1 TaxID=3413936 RepID=UPI003C7CDE35
MNRRQTSLLAATNGPTALSFSFGPFKLIPARQLLLRKGTPVPIGARAIDLLTALVQRNGEVVSKDQLMAAAWPDIFVHESNLKVNMSTLRRSLGDTQKQPTYIATIAGRGYRFVAAVRTSSLDEAEQELATHITRPSELPTQGQVIGRDDEIASLLHEVRRDRLVTIVGAGGIGKTTVAIEVAQTLRSEFSDGICFVDLSAIDSPTLVAGSLIASLGIRGDPSDSVTAVLDHLCLRKILVVLDNCEHVLPAAAIFARRFAAAAGASALLATSREPLGTNAERVFWLGPLRFCSAGDPTSVEETLRLPALDLFARRVWEWSGYQLVDSDCAAVAQICRSLDGLPLAIELAAAKLENRRPQELLEMMGEHLSFRAQRNHGVPARQETLLATIDWSYGLLSQDEATIFRLVAVFVGAFELEDVVAVAAAAGLNPMGVTIGLGGLVAKSLVTAEVIGPGLRYRLLDSTRHYALQRLLGDPIEGRVRHCHAQRMLTIFEQSAGDWDWRETDDWISRYRGRLGDLRSALSWSFGEGCRPELGVRLTVAAIPLWFETSLVSEARQRVEFALQLGETFPCDDLLKAKLACARAWNLAYSRKVLPELLDAWTIAIEIAKRSENIGQLRQAMLGRCLCLLETGFIPQAIKSFEELRDLSERHRDWSVMPEVERALALARTYTGHLSEGRQVLDRLAATHARPDRRSRMAGFQVDRYIGVRCHLPFVAWLNGHPDYAASTARDAVEAAGSLGHRVSQSNAIAMAALPVALWNADVSSLDRYTAQLKSIVEIENIAIWIPDQQFYAAALGDLLGEEEAVAKLRKAVAAVIDCCLCSRIAMKVGILADALARRGRLSEAGDAIAEAFRHQERQGERWCRSELQRIEASILHRAGEHARAEQALESALGEARAIEARSFELRIATDLASHFVDIGRCDDAVGILQPVYRRFSEGLETRDLMAAAEILYRASGVSPQSSRRPAVGTGLQ